MADRRPPKSTLLLLALLALVFGLALPGALREAFERGGLYAFTGELFADLPARLSGPGRFRFVLQPLVAILLGVRDGLADARLGRPAPLAALLVSRDHRRRLLRSAAASIANLVLMAILLDGICQWLILGVTYPGAALVVGPLLITVPYLMARGLAVRRAASARAASPPASR